MISIVCPHCSVKLKVDETKVPKDIAFFPCPKCKGEVKTDLLREAKGSDEPTFRLKNPFKPKIGKFVVSPSEQTPSFTITLKEGSNLIGRMSQKSTADIKIPTKDLTMSRLHILVEIRKDKNGNYIHFLSDRGSKNKTYFNGIELTSDEVVVLGDRDRVVIGNTTLIFTEEKQP